VPSNTEKYPLGGIVSAIQNAFHVTPEIACSNGALEEIYLCFCKDFKVTPFTPLEICCIFLGGSSYTKLQNFLSLRNIRFVRSHIILVAAVGCVLSTCLIEMALL